MPNKKQFEAFNINDFIYGNRAPRMLSMIDISYLFFEHINMVYTYILDGKTVSIEVPNDEDLYHVKRDGEHRYIVYGSKFIREEQFHMTFTSIDFVNWLFAKAPYISMVGYSNAE